MKSVPGVLEVLKDGARVLAHQDGVTDRSELELVADASVFRKSLQRNPQAGV